MSETDFLKLKKHDNVETNTEKFDIENYLNGNWDKINENAKKTNNQILQLETEKAKLETELKEMQKDIYQSSIRGQASGEYIHVEDSSGARCKIGIYGNSEQETRSGKNLFKPLNFTNNGITITYDKDGVGTIKGTSTNTWANISANVVYSYPAGNYVLSIDKPKTFNVHLKGIYIDKEVFEFAIPAGSKTKNVAFKKEVYSMYAFISDFAAGTTLDDTIKIQLEKGSTATDFEQYGVSPSPDYPSEIKTVGSNINLYDKDKKVDNTALDLNNGLSVGFRDRATSDYITVKANTNYIFSENGEELKVNIVEYDENKQFIKGYTGTSFIASSNTKYIRFYFNIVDMEIIKLEEGTIATSYSSYGQGSVKLTKCNKNLFDKSNWESGYVGEDGNNASSTTNFRLTKFIKVKPNTQYTISSNTVMKTLRLHEYNKDKTYIKFTYSTDKEKLTIVTSENTKYLRFSGNYNSPSSYTQSVIDGLGIILEEGNIRTAYEEHQEQSYIMPIQQPMRSIGDIRDTFIKKENKWYERHYITRKIFDGTEDWKLYGANASTYRRFGLAITGDIPKTIKILSDGNKFGKGVCSHFKVDMDYRTTDLIEFIQIGSPSWYIGITDFNSKWADIEILKTYLSNQYNAGTPVYVDYILETPIDIECTEEQSKILDELNNARTYKNVTNITTDSIAILDLDYAKDLETLLNNTQALAVNNASEGV